jgi:hypothetical protein
MSKFLFLIGSIYGQNIQEDFLKFSNDGEFDLSLNDPDLSYGFYEPSKMPSPDDVDLPPDAFKPMSWFCEQNGFKWEEHTVTTDDGYILSLWRIPGTNTSDTIGAPVLL